MPEKLLEEKEILAKERKKEKEREYRKKNTKTFSLMLRVQTEDDIIEQLESQPNIAAYLKSLIRKDIHRERFEAISKKFQK